mmetsp:Transcript_54983/g.99025  ORF Transcript_54983/g.99025 Transcript_54983/m.99025 type:complete len:206 (-) Transcript_54983:95-712(-)
MKPVPTRPVALITKAVTHPARLLTVASTPKPAPASSKSGEKRRATITVIAEKHAKMGVRQVKSRATLICMHSGGAVEEVAAPAPLKPELEAPELDRRRLEESWRPTAAVEHISSQVATMRKSFPVREPSSGAKRRLRSYFHKSISADMVVSVPSIPALIRTLDPFPVHQGSRMAQMERIDATKASVAPVRLVILMTCAFSSPSGS